MAPAAAFVFLLAMSCAAQEYAGSKACAKCYRAIYESYSATPMALSAAAPGRGIARETFGNASFTRTKTGWRYRVSEERGAYTLAFDRAAGDPSGEKRLAYAIGSGATARSYLLEDEGFLYEAPVAYYSSSAMWALEPGNADYDYPYLTRPIPPTCLIGRRRFLRAVSRRRWRTHCAREVGHDQRWPGHREYREARS